MRLSVVSFKDCWREDNRWVTTGGFPLQVTALSWLFDDLSLALLKGGTTAGGTALPVGSDVRLMEYPKGQGLRRKVSVFFHLPTYLTAISRQCRGADVVYIPLPGDIPLLGMFAARRLGRRILGRYGGAWVPCGGTTMANEFTKRWMRRLAQCGHVMLATGEGADEPAPGMHWLFATALSEASIEEAQRRRTRVEPSGALRLVYLGRLSQEKGLDHLLEGFARVVRGEFGPMDAHLTLIGDGPERGHLQRRVSELHLGGLVGFSGQLPHAKAMEVLLESDVCILPSLTESYCKARLDALACSVPVITTEVGFGRHFVGNEGERGWLVRVADPADVARRILQASGPSVDWSSLRRRCREYAQGRTLEKWSAQIGEICAQKWGMALVNGKLRPAAPGVSRTIAALANS